MPFLSTETLRKRVHGYLAEAMRGLDSHVVVVGGTEDHIHGLCTLPKNLKPTEFIGKVKSASSKWAKGLSRELDDFYWQAGFAMFSVSESKVSVVTSYIENQMEHHKTISFQDELRTLLRKHGVGFDEQYLWD